MGCCYGCQRPGWNEFDDLTCGDQWCSCHDFCATGERPAADPTSVAWVSVGA